MTDIFCIPLAECRGEADVGGKAANLGVMIRNGIPVPTGFAVTNRAFESFCRINSLSDRLSSIRQKIDFDLPVSVGSAAEEIRSLILGGRIPDEIWAPLLAHARDLTSRRIIVRSSAMGEDSGTASFAGQLDSIPAPNNPESLMNALLRCWASFWSERSLSYQEQRGLRLSGMGAVIQEMVESKIAGVLFTCSPASSSGPCTREENPLLLEYVFGQGEGLVSGRVNPGRIVVCRSTDRWEKVADPENRNGSESDFAWLLPLKRHALELEKIMGKGQDIEWAVDPNRSLFLLQSRPITRSGTASGSMRNKVLWSNVNVNENYPDPISPLLYSIALRSYYFYFRNLGKAFGISETRLNSMETDLSAIIGTHGARMYYNLTNIYRVIRVLPFGRKIAAFFDSFVGVNEPLDPGFKDDRFRPTLHTLQEVAELVRMVGVTFRTFLLLPWRIRSLEKLVDRHLDACLVRGKDNGTEALRLRMADFREFLDIRFHHWRKAALADVAAMFTYGLLKEVIEHALGKKEGVALHNTLLKGIPDLVSGKPSQRLWELSQEVLRDVELRELFRSADSLEIEKRVCTAGGEFPMFSEQLDCFLADWGFRCSGELMLTVPNFREIPSALFDILKGYVETRIESPESMIERQEKERERILCTIRPRMSRISRIALRSLLWATHHSIAFRERVRMKQAALYGQFRQTVLWLGGYLAGTGRIETAEDIFYLKYQEIDHLFADTEMLSTGLKPLIELRKEHFRRVSQLHPPEYLLLSKGEYYDGTQPAFHSGRNSARAGTTDGFYGTGACGGRVEGKARVLENVLQANQLKAGEILVTRQTDPGWGPVFPLIKGLVMERGGMLSHGAIIAREFGIPAVVGIPRITQLIDSGQTILVDGDEGYVSF